MKKMLLAAAMAMCSGISRAELPGLYFQATNAAGDAGTQRRCWTYDKSMITIAFKGKDALKVTTEHGSCVVKRDPSYPSSHVPKEYQGWFRYREDAKTDESTRYGKDNPCTKAFDLVGDAPFDDGGVFMELRLDSALLASTFKGSAKLQVDATGGDSGGPLHLKYICR